MSKELAILPVDDTIDHEMGEQLAAQLELTLPGMRETPDFLGDDEKSSRAGRVCPRADKLR